MSVEMVITARTTIITSVATKKKKEITRKSTRGLICISSGRPSSSSSEEEEEVEEEDTPYNTYNIISVRSRVRYVYFVYIFSSQDARGQKQLSRDRPPAARCRRGFIDLTNTLNGHTHNFGAYLASISHGPAGVTKSTNICSFFTPRARTRRGPLVIVAHRS